MYLRILPKKFLWFIPVLLVPQYNLVIKVFLFYQTATNANSITGIKKQLRSRHTLCTSPCLTSSLQFEMWSVIAKFPMLEGLAYVPVFIPLADTHLLS